MSEEDVKSQVPPPKKARTEPSVEGGENWQQTGHMKKVSLLHDANFPRDPEGRVYHLAVKHGQVASRILSVGDPRRAELLSALLDDPAATFVCTSNRGFTVYTGTFQKVPVSIVATGMGLSMMDFVVRETRAVCEPPMAIIRLGTCGTVSHKVGLGWAVVADAAVGVQRNPDAFRPGSKQKPYTFLQPVAPDGPLYDLLLQELRAGSGMQVAHGLNGSADSFYSSQGRTSSYFDDRNEALLDELTAAHPDTATLEMETFHLYDLASVSHGAIRAAAAHVTLAQRRTNEMADFSKLHDWEARAGRSCLQALIKVDLSIPPSAKKAPQPQGGTESSSSEQVQDDGKKKTAGNGS